MRGSGPGRIRDQSLPEFAILYCRLCNTKRLVTSDWQGYKCAWLAGPSILERPIFGDCHYVALGAWLSLT